MFYTQDATAVLTIDKSRVTAGGFEQGAPQFCLMKECGTAKYIGETQKIYVINKYCTFIWCN
jgi:hypothetical protein